MPYLTHCHGYTGPIKGVVLDWAGTAVDYGCRGPAAVFVRTFEQFAIAVSIAEARRFMGLAKKDHIRAMCALESVKTQWQSKYGHLPAETDIDALYRLTEPMMIACLPEHAVPIPGVLETVTALRNRHIRIGSCTGYTRPMMEVLVPAAREKGYQPDAVVCSSDVPAGRPYPWMCYLNAIQLDVYPMQALVKIGDTLSDIEEGLNAGMWTIGITRTGNELGLSQAQAQRLAEPERSARLTAIEARFQAAGAHYCVEAVAEIPPVIDDIEARLRTGEHPHCNPLPNGPG